MSGKCIGVAFAAITVSIVVASCSSDVNNSSVESSPPATASAAQSMSEETSTPSSSDEIILDTTTRPIHAAYMRLFDECLPKVGAEPIKARELLTPCARGPYLEHMVGQLSKSYAQKKMLTKGKHTSRAQGVSVLDASTATIEDCIDSSAVETYDEASGTTKFVGPAQNSYLTTMRKVDEEWFVWARVAEEDPERFCRQ